LSCIDFKLAEKVAKNIGSDAPEKPGRKNHGKSSKSLSQVYYAPKVPTIIERRIAILVEDGFDLEEVKVVRNALTSAKARTFIIGPRRGEIYPMGVEPAKGNGIKADHHFEGQRSTLFDAVYIPSGKEHIDKLFKNGRAVQYVREAFGHCKAIGAVGPAIQFLQNVDLPGVEFQHGDSAKVTSSYGVVTTGRLDTRYTSTDAMQIKPASKDFMVEFAYVISCHRCYEREMDGLTSGVAY
jgi:catalase